MSSVEQNLVRWFRLTHYIAVLLAETAVLVMTLAGIYAVASVFEMQSRRRKSNEITGGQRGVERNEQ